MIDIILIEGIGYHRQCLTGIFEFSKAQALAPPPPRQSLHMSLKD